MSFSELLFFAETIPLVKSFRMRIFIRARSLVELVETMGCEFKLWRKMKHGFIPHFYMFYIIYLSVYLFIRLFFSYTMYIYFHIELLHLQKIVRYLFLK